MERGAPRSFVQPAARQFRRSIRAVLAATGPYEEARNDASRPEGASTLSPYLHFGVVGPREVMKAIKSADIPAQQANKFTDELLTWREWF